jgi:hypothetical protein
MNRSYGRRDDRVKSRQETIRRRTVRELKYGAGR